MYVTTADDPDLARGAEVFDGFEVDDVFHAPSGADIHFCTRVPEAADASERPLFVTLPGWEGLYFQGVAENLRWERFAQEAAASDEHMIVLAPQLDDWGWTSANQTIELVEHFVAHYGVDASRVYIEGYSGGGETLSLVMEERPELFCAALAVSSQWDGELTPLVEARTPLYLFTGRDDSYYGSGSFVQTADELQRLYREKGLSEEEIAELVVLDVKEAAYFEALGYSDQHMGGGAAATDDTAMGWLFAH